MDKKVTVVGGGFVGATTARRIVEKDLADVVLVDIAEGVPQGKALDVMEAAPLIGTDKKIIGTVLPAFKNRKGLVIIHIGLGCIPIP